MIRLLLRLDRFPRHERPTLIVLGVLLPLASLAVRLLGFGRSQRLVQWLGARGQPPRQPGTEDIEAAQRLAELARLVGHRHPLPASCLRQSLVVSLLLNRQGFDAPIRLGVANTIDRAPAHAWVELAGVALDPQAAGHRVFASRARAAPAASIPAIHRSPTSPPSAADRPVVVLLVLAMAGSVLAGFAPWTIRADVVTTPWPEETQDTGASTDATTAGASCPAPWSRPRPDAMGMYEAWLAFGHWPTAARAAVDVAMLGLLVLGLASWRRRPPDRWLVLSFLPLLVLALGSAISALANERWLEVLSGSRASLPWFLAAAATGIATRGVLRGLVLASIGLLALQGVLAPWELNSPNSPYGTALLGLQIHRLVGTFELPAALGAFAVATWAMSISWLEPRWRTRLLLSVLVVLVLLVCSSASAWVALAATTASILFFRLALRWRLGLLASALPLALALWLALPAITGRADVHDSLWGRVNPTLDFSREHLDRRATLVGYRFGAGTQGHEPLRLLVSERIEPPNLRPPTDSTPAVLYWQFGWLGMLAAYALMLLALARDRQSRPVGVALLVGSFFVSLAESVPLALLLALWLGRALGKRGKPAEGDG